MMNLACPRCASTGQVIKNGRSHHGHQRWRCKSCSLTLGERGHRLIKLSSRQDFVYYAHDPAQCMRLWRTAVPASEQLAEEFSAWLQQPDPAVLPPL